jgi:hypothetical protein
MSKGLGKIQRSVLAILEGGGVVTGIDMAGEIHGTTVVSPAQVESVSRAVRKLIAAGLVVDNGRRHPDGRRLLALARENPGSLLSNRAVARQLACSPGTVSAVRHKL